MAQAVFDDRIRWQVDGWMNRSGETKVLSVLGIFTYGISDLKPPASPPGSRTFQKIFYPSSESLAIFGYILL